MLASDLKKPAMRSYPAASKDFGSGARTPRRFLDDSLALGLQVIGYFDRDADAFAVAAWLMQAR